MTEAKQSTSGPHGPFEPELDGDEFARYWKRLTEILSVDWKRVFPEGKAEMDSTGFYVRISLGNQITGGTMVHARKHRYDPALEHAVATGKLELGENDDGEPVIRLPDGETGYGWNGDSDD